MESIINISRKRVLVMVVMVLALSSAGNFVYSQSDRQHIRAGNRDYRSGKFGESELAYRRATDLPKSTPDAWFNLGNAIYRQQRFEDAAATFERNASQNDDVVKRANSYYNQGNSLLSSQKIQESIEAYKKSLRLNPDNMEAKYNLAYAQDILREQEEQEQEQEQQQGQNQEKEEGEDKQQEGGDKERDQNKDQNKDQSQSDDNMKISQEDARRLLEALASDERNVQEKVMKDKAASAMVRTLKNW